MKRKKPTPLTPSEWVLRAERAISHLSDEKLIERIKKFCFSRLMALPLERLWEKELLKEVRAKSVWDSLGKRKVWKEKKATP